MPTKYKVIQLPSYNHRFDDPFIVGEIVYKLEANDYGSAATDSRLENTKCISVTRKSDGSYPFQTIPLNCIERVN